MEGSTNQLADDMTATSSDIMCNDTPRGAQRQTRRLSDKILIAFHQACDTPDLEIAGHLLRLLEIMLMRPPIHLDGRQRHNAEGFVAAHERLWYLQHPTTDQ